MYVYIEPAKFLIKFDSNCNCLYLLKNLQQTIDYEYTIKNTNKKVHEEIERKEVYDFRKKIIKTTFKYL